MDLAIKELTERINCYEFWVKDCYRYFNEPNEIYQARLNKLKGTLEQLKRVKKMIITNDSLKNKS